MIILGQARRSREPSAFSRQPSVADGQYMNALFPLRRGHEACHAEPLEGAMSGEKGRPAASTGRQARTLDI